MTQAHNEWQHQAVTLSRTGLMSWREIAKILRKPRSTVSDFLRAYQDKLSQEDVPNERLEAPGAKDNSRILFISDLHFPYAHPKVFEFLEGLKIRYNPTRVICLGDECEKSALSFHDSDPDLDSAGPELEKAIAQIAKLHRMFPVMDIVDSNHGSMVYRKAKHHGIPRKYIKSYNDVLEVGSGWQWHMDLTLQLPTGEWVYIHHGKSAEAIKVSQTMGMSHVCGHYHESFGVKYWATPVATHFAMNCGCLIDDSSLAFAYNNVNLKRPIIGTGLIIDGYPVLEPMPL